jgi:hypothetical protein
VIDNATIAVLLTAAGAPIGSAVVWAVVDFIKSSPFSGLVAGREKAAAFVGAAVIVLFAYFVGLTSVPPTQVVSPLAIAGVLLAFYNIGRLAMAVHDDVNRKPNSLTA